MQRTVYEETHFEEEGRVRVTNRLFEDNRFILKVETKKVSRNWASIRYRLATIEDHAKATTALLESLTQTLPH